MITVPNGPIVDKASIKLCKLPGVRAWFTPSGSACALNGIFWVVWPRKDNVK